MGEMCLSAGAYMCCAVQSMIARGYGEQATSVWGRNRCGVLQAGQMQASGHTHIVRNEGNVGRVVVSDDRTASGEAPNYRHTLTESEGQKG